MSQTLTLRVPEENAEEVRRIARKQRRSVSETGARMVDEWIRQAKCPEIEFRDDSLGERTACLKGRLEVWQVMMIAREYGEDIQGIADHLVLQPGQVRAALDYYAAYPEEIDRALAENDANDYETLKRRYPQVKMGLTEVTDEALARIEQKYQFDGATL